MSAIYGMCHDSLELIPLSDVMLNWHWKYLHQWWYLFKWVILRHLRLRLLFWLIVCAQPEKDALKLTGCDNGSLLFLWSVSVLEPWVRARCWLCDPFDVAFLNHIVVPCIPTGMLMNQSEIHHTFTNPLSFFLYLYGNWALHIVFDNFMFTRGTTGGLPMITTRFQIVLTSSFHVILNLATLSIVARKPVHPNVVRDRFIPQTLLSFFGCATTVGQTLALKWYWIKQSIRST